MPVKPSVAGLVTQYLEHNPHEADRLAQLRALLAQFSAHDDLIARTNFVGHITASGFVLSADRRTMLLVAHRGLGLFLQPGGHLDPADASPRAGALREVHEETGLTGLETIPLIADPDTPFDIDIHHIPANPRKDEPEHWHHDLRYLLICRDDAQVRLQMRLASEEVREARWISIHEIANYPTFERVGVKLQSALAVNESWGTIRTHPFDRGML